MRAFSFLAPFLSSFFIIFLAELGDKTQLLSVGFAARYNLKSVIGGVVAATFLLMLLPVLAGKAITALLPTNLIQMGAAFLFFSFGIWILFTKEKKEEKTHIKKGKPFLTVFSGLFLAELGDKTQLATAVIAAKYETLFQVWLGASLGMIAANLLGVFVGNRLQAYLPYKKIRVLAAIIFILFGIITFIQVI